MNSTQHFLVICMLSFCFWGCNKEPIALNETSDSSYTDGGDLTSYFPFSIPSTNDNCEKFLGNYERSFKVCFNRSYYNQKYFFSCGLRQYNNVEFAAPYSLSANYFLKKYNLGDTIGPEAAWYSPYFQDCLLLEAEDYQFPQATIPCNSFWVTSINGNTTQTITLAEGYVGVRKPIDGYYSSGSSPKGYLYGYIKLRIYQDYYQGNYYVNVEYKDSGFKKLLDTPIKAGE